ncbi:MAG: VOC family protein [Bacilli bacterium]|nr:VOC family protein [Bacilli bacterium]
MKFNKLIPELSVSDINISKEFYLKLGFKIMYERVENKFCFLELDGNQIMIEELNGNWDTGIMEYPYGRGINLSMSVDDIDKMYKMVRGKNIKLFLDLEVHQYRVDDKVYEDKEFLVQDPDGYLLRFNN